MAEFQPLTQRFDSKGLSLSCPEDAVPEGKFPVFQNMRSALEGTIEPRAGTETVNTTPGQTDVHSLGRLNDETPFNEGGLPARRVAGAGPALHSGAPTDASLPTLDTGYSGDPLTFVTAQPVGTPQPWLYVADRERQRKLNVAGQIFDTGIAPPVQAPFAELARPRLTVIDAFEYPASTMPWLSAGAVASVPILSLDVSTTIAAILYDKPAPSHALVELTTFTGPTGTGSLLIFATSLEQQELVLVEDVKIPIIPSTIAGILYDNGVSPGLCTIQPTGSLGTGSLQTPTYDQLRRRQPGRYAVERGTAGTPPVPDAPPIDPAAATPALRSIDFPVDCLVKINVGQPNEEFVRILSMATGPDEVQSFRCWTNQVHVAGETLTGIPALRVYLANTYDAGHSVSSQSVTNKLTPSATDVKEKNDIVGGVRSGYPFFTTIPNVPPYPPNDPQGPGGGGGTGGTLNHLDVVIAAKAELVAEGADLTLPCGSHKITQRVAQKLAGEGAGFLKKTSGNNCDGKSVDRIMYPNGALYDVIGDSYSVDDVPGSVHANNPIWSPDPPADPALYIPFGPSPVPPPATRVGDPVPTITQLDLSKVGDRMTLPDDEFHLSLKMDKIEAVKEVRIYFDVDPLVNDFTRNVYFKHFSHNDLLGAVQAFNGIDVTTVITQQQGTAVPNEQTRTATASPGGYTPGSAQAPTQGTGQPTHGVVTPGGYTQLGLGQFQWMELRWKVKDMLHVGSDATRSLKDVRGIEILLKCATVLKNSAGKEYPIGTVTVFYDSLWLGGGFGPNVGAQGTPYLYATRYRSSVTGATSGPGPATRGGISPRRQRVILTSPTSPDPQVDKIDYFRFGGVLPRGAYFGTTANVATTFNDDFADDAISGNEIPDYTQFQPWPTSDVPRTGTCTVAGSAVQWVSGDLFDVTWAPGSLIRIKGIVCRLYAQPTSPTFLHVLEAMGAFTNVSFEVPSATVMGSHLPTLWGPYGNFYFAIGDPINPGLLKWTAGNNPDVTHEANTLQVTSPSTPLMNGFVWDNAAFVFNTEDLFRILPDFSHPNQFVTNVLPCGRGLWTRWAWCLTPFGVAFLGKDGIYLSNAGAPAKSLTDADLYAIFPHEGVLGVRTRGVDPPDMAQAKKLRLAYADGFLFFDYAAMPHEGGTGVPAPPDDFQDEGYGPPGPDRTLVYDMKGDRWTADRHAVPVAMHAWEPGAGVHDVLLGRGDGTIGHFAHRVGDDGGPVYFHFRTTSMNGGDIRREKLIGDCVLEFNPDGGPGVTVVVGLDCFDEVLPDQSVGTTGAFYRHPYIIDLNLGLGAMARSVGLDIRGESLTAVPRFYYWVVSLIPKADNTARRATDWEDAGYCGAKFVQGVLIDADTEGTTRTIRVEYDGGQLGGIITLNGNAQELVTAHSFSTPFIGHLLRLWPTDDGEWLLYRRCWVWEPSPELAAYWITQPTTHDFPGYLHVERALIAHMSRVNFELIVTADGQSVTYPVTHSNDAFVKTEILMVPNKGKVYQYALRTVDGSERMRIFLKDCEVRAKPWGSPQPYQIIRPFGDLSREHGGARI